jgi:hypothetical protein
MRRSSLANREFIQCVQCTGLALKREGKSIDEAVAAVVAEIRAEVPEFGNATNAGVDGPRGVRGSAVS